MVKQIYIFSFSLTVYSSLSNIYTKTNVLWNQYSKSFYFDRRKTLSETNTNKSVKNSTKKQKQGKKVYIVSFPSLVKPFFDIGRFHWDGPRRVGRGQVVVILEAITVRWVNGEIGREKKRRRRMGEEEGRRRGLKGEKRACACAILTMMVLELGVNK